MSQKHETELLKCFREMTIENRNNFLAYAQIALAAQENTRKAMEKTKKERKPRASA